MHPSTRAAVAAYCAQLAGLNSVGSVAEKFNVSPAIQQKMETKIQESSGFLKLVNVVPVRDQEGEKLGLGVSGPTASRTDTKTKDRQTRDVSAMDSTRYRCEQTNFDTHLDYRKLDMWTAFPDFQTRLRDAILQRQALDRIMIGFNGRSVAAETDLAANPMLQDVNKGWLQMMRETAPDRVLAEVVEGSGKVKVGGAAGADYKNLDALVFDAMALLDPWHHNASDLVVMLGRDLLHDKYFPLVNVNQAPTEQLASQVIVSQKRVGNLPAAQVPYFPANGLLITSYDNLSIYWQREQRRRMFIDNPRRDRYENFESSNDAYVVEDIGKAVFIENIESAE